LSCALRDMETPLQIRDLNEILAQAIKL